MGFRVLAFSASRRSKTGQEAPKTAPRRPNRPPREPQDGLIASEDGVRGAQDCSRAPEDGPKEAREGGRKPKIQTVRPKRPTGGLFFLLPQRRGWVPPRAPHVAPQPRRAGAPPREAPKLARQRTDYYLDNNTDCNAKVVPHVALEPPRTPSAPTAQRPSGPNTANRLLTIRSHHRGRPPRTPS